MFRFDFTKKEYDCLIERCCFTDEELKVLDMRRRGKSICYMSIKLNLSERTIKRRIKSAYKKILKEM